MKASILVTYTMIIIESLIITAASDVQTNIDNAMNYISNTTEYNITDTGYLYKNASGYTVGDPGGGYGHFQFYNNTINTDDIISQVSTEFLMSANDAIVFIGNTPPQCKYFSFVLYLCEKLYGDYPYIDDNRTELFASLIPTLNHLLLNTSGNNYYDYQDVFNQTIIIIITGSKQTYSDLYNIFSSYNLSSIINLMPIVSDYVNFSAISMANSHYDQHSVSGLNVALRVALPQNQTTYNTFMNNRNETIYYISSSNKDLNSSTDRYWSENWKENTFSPLNMNETTKYSDLFDEYKQDVISYLTNTSTYNMTFDRYYDFHAAYGWRNESNNYGWDCIDNDVNCKMDNRDCYYSVSSNSELPLLAEEKTFWLFVGVNHHKTNQTTYSLFALWSGNPETNLRVNSYEVDNYEYGNKPLLNDDKYSIFYAVQFSRKENCISQPVISGFCIDYKPEDFKNNFFLILGRDYLNPTTKTRPNASELIKHVLMKFTLP